MGAARSDDAAIEQSFLAASAMPDREDEADVTLVSDEAVYFLQIKLSKERLRLPDGAVVTQDGGFDIPCAHCGVIFGGTAWCLQNEHPSEWLCQGCEEGRTDDYDNDG